MPDHTPQITSEDAGHALASRLQEIVEDITQDVETVVKVTALDDIELSTILVEISILAYVAQRIAIQTCAKTRNHWQPIIQAFDHYTSFEVLNDSRYGDLLDLRGKQYFRLFSSYHEEIEANSWEEFFRDLACVFQQYCRGRVRDDDPIIVTDNPYSIAPLSKLATKCWRLAFIGTFEYLHSIEVGLGRGNNKPV